jgi:hypothetical protein
LGAAVRNHVFDVFPIVGGMVVLNQVCEFVNNDVINDSVWGHDDSPVVGNVTCG